MMEQMTEETEWEYFTEETMAENLERDIGARAFVLTTFLSACGWILPDTPYDENVKIPGSIWLFSAAFHAISLAIWIEILVSSIQNKESRRTIETNLIMLGISLLSSFAFFIYFHVES